MKRNNTFRAGFLLLLFSPVVAGAQNLNITGDTISVPVNNGVELRFPAVNSIPRLLDTTASYSIQFTGAGFIIKSNSATAAPTVLMVTEGPGQLPRQHKFVVVAGNESSPVTLKDWSTILKLQDYVRELTATRKPAGQDAVSAGEIDLPGLRSPAEDSNMQSYKAIIKSADAAFAERKYENAKKLYTDASNIAENEVYPVYQLIQVTRLLGQAKKGSNLSQAGNPSSATSETSYENVMKQASAAYNKQDNLKAKTLFLKAIELNPDEPEPKQKLELLMNKINAENLTNKYDAAILNGNTALEKHDNKLALRYFNAALIFRPSDAYAAAQAKSVKQLLEKKLEEQQNLTRSAEFNANQQMLRKRFDDGMKAYAGYEKAAQLANYEEQVLCLKEFLNTIPDNSLFSRTQYSNDPIGFAKAKIQAIRDHLTRTKGSRYQVDALPYLNVELEAKYPGINFSIPPPDQQYSPTTLGEPERSQMLKTLFNEKPGVLAEDSSKQLKIICQSLSSSKQYIYLKLMLQNNSEREFLVGSIFLQQVSRDKSISPFAPAFVSSFPVILPGKEFPVVVAFEKFNQVKNARLRVAISNRFEGVPTTLNLPDIVLQAITIQ